MKGSGHVKDELWRILFKLSHFRPEITKFRVCTFGKITDSANVASDTVILTPSHPLFAIFGCASGQIFEKMRV